MGTYPALTDLGVRITQARVRDAEAVRELAERWQREIAPETDGWLATTAGISDDGEFVSLLRFASEEAVRRNAESERQRRWWEEFRQYVSGDVSIVETSSAAAFGDSRPDADVGYVHVVQGEARIMIDILEGVAEHEEHHIREHHLPLLGGIIVDHGGDRFTEFMYFPSEDEKGRGIGGTLPEEGVTMVERVAGHVANIRHLAISDPWTHVH